MSEMIVQRESLQSVADKIKAKAGTTGDLVFPEGFENAVDSISGGDTTVEDSLITGTPIQYSNPRVKAVRNYAFYYYSNLASVNLPLVTNIGSYAFSGCSNLTSVDLPLVTSMPSYAFSDCSKFTALILRSETMCTLSNTNTFLNCYRFHGTVNATYNPEGLKDGYIYVPSALIEDYKAATNWSTFATQFRALEDYTVDGTTTGALDETKIGV